MKRKLLFLMVFAFAVSLPWSLQAQSQVESVIIQQVNQNLRGAAIVLGQSTITTSEPGTVIVEFDGNCVSTEGDRILLAASNSTGWSVNDGHVAVEAYDSDINRHSFSHTRKYDVGAGNHTFYAVGQNFVETDGSGVASVYGNLTVKFYPSNGSIKALHTGIVDVNRDLNSGVEEIASLTLDAPEDGKVLVRFNGMCVSDPDDLIVIAASNNIGWVVNDGNTGTEAIDNDLNTRVFSHSRVYDITSGTHTFYAVAQNFVETGGDGKASFYGSLTVTYFPNNTNISIDYANVNKTDIDVEGDPVVMGEVTINPSVAGKVVVNYNGLCASSPDDRVVMAASNTTDWSSNSGNVNVEAISTDLNYNNFSHTRVYDIAAGSHTFYAICENFVETAGNGIASNYATLTVQFFPDEEIISSIGELINLSQYILISPNPVTDRLNIQLTDFPEEKYVIDIFDSSGKLILNKVASAESNFNLEVSSLTKGNYFVRLKGESVGGVKQFTVY